MGWRLPSLLAAVVLGLWLPAGALALDSDKDQPATLQADDFELDLDTGVRTYRGNVVFRQGSLHLDCDALVTHYDEDGEFDKGVCTGSPGRFKQRPEGRDADVSGRALSITLDKVADTVMLEGAAEVEQAGDRIQGGRITYDLETRKAKVTGGATSSAADDSGARPRLIIRPPPE